ncbi:DUF6946 family protein [Falsiroseomonas sp. CW058]|uniref:DUF6946 family protein n=1 Tax=Falsiroseomonas sp. CW058 TaxID=3388664 RepID=UPI003D3202E7
MTRFFALTEIRRPENVIPFLGKPELHWKPGYSASELARSWVTASDCIPASVRAVLETSDEYRGAELVEGFFERQVDLRTLGRASQTDLLVLLRVGGEFAVLAVEGKVEEAFGLLVSEWDDGSPGKRARLAGLCGVLGLDPDAVRALRYQLLHRAVSAVFEADRYGCRRATSGRTLRHRRVSRPRDRRGGGGHRPSPWRPARKGARPEAAAAGPRSRTPRAGAW